MTYEQAANALGFHGLLKRSIGDGPGQRATYEWRFQDGSVIQAIFIGNHLDSCQPS